MLVLEDVEVVVVVVVLVVLVVYVPQLLLNTYVHSDGQQLQLVTPSTVQRCDELRTVPSYWPQ